MSDQRPSSSDPATSEAAALRQAGASPLRPGDPEQVGPSVPLALLGSGGMGRVYLARPVDDSREWSCSFPRLVVRIGPVRA